MRKYEIKFITLKSGRQIPKIVFEEDKNELLAAFLGTDIENFPEKFKKVINNVISGKQDYGEWTGNQFTMEVHPDKTKLIDNFWLDENGEYDNYEVDTHELCELIDFWIDYRKKWKNARNKPRTPDT